MSEKVRGINTGRNDKNGEPPRALASRRLAAIIAGDIAGYTRLMEFDEEGTHVRVKRIQRDLIEILPAVYAVHDLQWTSLSIVAQTAL